MKRRLTTKTQRQTNNRYHSKTRLFLQTRRASLWETPAAILEHTIFSQTQIGMFKFQPVLFFLALSLAACTSAPAQVANIAHNPPESAHNVNVTATRIEAAFKDACFVVYLDGNGASAMYDGRQNDFDCAVSETLQNEWTAANSETGDYVVLNTLTGVVTTKIEGVFGIFLPTVEGAAGM